QGQPQENRRRRSRDLRFKHRKLSVARQTNKRTCFAVECARSGRLSSGRLRRVPRFVRQDAERRSPSTAKSARHPRQHLSPVLCTSDLKDLPRVSSATRCAFSISQSTRILEASHEDTEGCPAGLSSESRRRRLRVGRQLVEKDPDELLGGNDQRRSRLL